MKLPKGVKRLHRVDVLVEEYKPEAMFLREQIASGTTCAGDEFTLSLGIGSSALLFKVGDGAWLVIPPDRLVEALLRLAGDL